MISNCGRDSRGQYRGDVAGDQDGGEWRIRSWYSYPWDWAIWHPDPKVNELVADLAEEAAANDLIGYDQGERETFWQHLKASGYRPAGITIACEADCSSGVAAIVKAVGYLIGSGALQGVPTSAYTGNLRQVLEAAGFQSHGEAKYLTSERYLPRGAILLNTKCHTCINVTKGAACEASSGGYVIAQPTSNGSDTVRQGQRALVADGFSVGSCGVDGCFGPDTRKACARHVQTALNGCGAGLQVDGDVGPLTRAAWGKYGPVRQGCGRAGLVRSVQIALTCRGYSVGSAGIDGDCGPDTASAIRAFQQGNGLGVDGICGPLTFAKLF